MGLKNPWTDLPSEAPYVLECDREKIEAFNRRFADQPDYLLQTQLYPEPYIGNPDSPIYLLGLNPGYDESDDAQHRDDAFTSAIRSNLRHDEVEIPFYFFDPRFAASPGARWWRGKCRWFANDGTDLATLAKMVFCVELFPYHSRKYRALAGGVASSEYSVELVRKAMDEGKIIVAMRAFNDWCSRIPRLSNYPGLLRLNSAQNVSLSPGNLKNGYDRILATLKGEATRLSEVDSGKPMPSSMASKVICSKCGAGILPATAERTGGLCMPCKNGTPRRPDHNVPITVSCEISSMLRSDVVVSALAQDLLAMLEETRHIGDSKHPNKLELEAQKGLLRHCIRVKVGFRLHDDHWGRTGWALLRLFEQGKASLGVDDFSFQFSEMVKEEWQEGDDSLAMQGGFSYKTSDGDAVFKVMTWHS